MSPGPTRLAVVIGATGIAGRALCAELVGRGDEVVGVSRRAPSDIAGVRPLLVDLTDPDAITGALAGLAPSQVYFTAWARQPSEAENIRVNGGMVRDVLGALAPARSLRHAALVTGLKHYMGPFEAYGTGEVRDTPFHEDEPRLSVDNFYYAQENELWAAAGAGGFTWSVHRSHTIIGAAVGNAMNMGTTIAVQAALCRHLGRPFAFPGNEIQWNGLTDMTDAGLLARHLAWAATTGAAANRAYNVANGDLFRWRWMWPRLAAMLGVEPEPYRDRPRPLAGQMRAMGPVWTEIARRHRLVEGDLDRVASWWHTDGDLSRPIECFTDMARSRAAGFTDTVSTVDSFAALFTELRRNRTIPVVDRPEGEA